MNDLPDFLKNPDNDPDIARLLEERALIVSELEHIQSEIKRLEQIMQSKPEYIELQRLKRIRNAEMYN